MCGSMYRFEFKAYRRRFAGVFSNARESHATREGLLFRLEDGDGRVGFGEAAPLPSFGTESFPVALSIAHELGSRLHWDEEFQARLRPYRALFCGIESAVGMVLAEGKLPLLEKPWPVCGLLPDPGDMEALERRRELHYRCLKLKVGKGLFLEELRQIDRIIGATGGEVTLRLDANGTLTPKEAAAWLERCAEWPVEFLEQPLPVGQEREMMRLADDFPTPIALDESVCAVDDLKRWRDAQWRGVYVLKPTLCGSLVDLRAELADGRADVVYSSGLETLVGARHALATALAVPGGRRALGFGADALFVDKNVGLSLGPFLQNKSMPNTDDCQLLWNRI